MLAVKIRTSSVSHSGSMLCLMYLNTCPIDKCPEYVRLASCSLNAPCICLVLDRNDRCNSNATMLAVNVKVIVWRPGCIILKYHKNPRIIPGVQSFPRRDLLEKREAYLFDVYTPV